MADIGAPVTLIGLGRSGTTLIEKAFSSCMDVCSCGETGGIIFGTYAGAMDSYFDSPNLNYETRETFSADVVRKLFQSLFPISEAEHWFHKPAGIPKMIPWEAYRVQADRFEFPTTWYWNTFDAVFPRARYITVLRNPWDIVISRMAFSGWPEVGLWNDIKIMYDFIYERLDDIDVLFYEDIQRSPYDEMRLLFSRLGITPGASLEEICLTRHVPSEETGKREISNGLEGPNYDAETVNLVRGVWERFGRNFASPPGLLEFFSGRRHDG